MELDLVEAPTAEMVGWCNDRAHGLDAAHSMTKALGPLDADPHIHPYAALRDGELVCAGLFRHDEGNVYVYGLAVVPEAQGTGIGFEVLRLSHREGIADGCTTVTSDVTRGGFAIGERMGKRSLGQCDIWVRTGLLDGSA
jgi:ribosomal protein S18 acetylase RimI-like enzyme